MVFVQSFYIFSSYNYVYSCVLSKLIDKGASVRKTHDLLKTEIENRKLTESFSKLELPSNEPSHQYMQYICAKEVAPKKDRFKPFECLKDREAHIRHSRLNGKEISAAVEPNWTNMPTRPLPLKESLDLQIQHVKKLKVVIKLV